MVLVVLTTGPGLGSALQQQVAIPAAEPHEQADRLLETQLGHGAVEVLDVDDLLTVDLDDYAGLFAEQGGFNVPSTSRLAASSKR